MSDDQNPTEGEANTDETGQQNPQTTPPQPTGSEWENSTGKGGKEAVLADLAAERKSRKELEKRLKEFEDRDKSELQKATERAEAAEMAIQSATRKAVAAAHGIPGELVDAIKGDTEEEMTAAAKVLAGFLKPKEDEGKGRKDAFLPGRRGRPVGSANKGDADNWLRGLVS